ncbi:MULTISPECIES: carbohydrate ABC transporter permease [Sinorhizobium]|uniref:carbohydrate ABC transporter permease n=1 Tax=Sinorhizobium TaxID=28105 RepID=UPI0004B6F2FB|nr:MULTISPECIES: carbohydrate ABC transporter permease [Sinorhizobium]ASY60617.1 Various polyols ABC transporter, permease component 2 [Sinorhizobium sp. CCBAU 05631]ASY74209.1 Various polyols ABC transporter, permease component 2 [Sinorhizobium fredii CCBAU 83666]
MAISSRTNRTTRKLLWTLFWGVLACVYLFPYTWMVLTGFRHGVDTISMPPRFIFEPTLAGFRHLFEVTGFQKYIINSAVVTILSVVLVIGVSAPAAYALAQISKRGGALLVAILVARIIPGIAIGVPVYLLATRLHQLDTYQALVIINVAVNIPFAIWLMRSFFMEVHPTLREAAISDGCSEWQVFTKIMLPLVLGGMLATSVFVFIAVWNKFLFALILTTSVSPTAPLAMLGFRTQYGVQWDAVGAAAFLVSTPVIVFAFIMQRYLVQGLTMGSVK